MNRRFLLSILILMLSALPVTAAEEIFCPDVWDPVCGQDGQTYPNACYARHIGVACQDVCPCTPPPPPPPPPEAYFCVEDATGDSFVLKLVEQDKIDHARRILSGEETQVIRVQGDVIPGPIDWNPGWNFRIKPDTASFFELQIEVCDAAIAWVDVNGGPYYGFWCPWTSEVTAELTNPEIETGSLEASGVRCGPLL